jgi:hypothetical protein
MKTPLGIKLKSVGGANYFYFAVVALISTTNPT